LTSPSRSPVETTRPSRSSSGESGRRIAVASPSGSTSGSARSARRLQPGQSLRIPAGVDALLEFPTSEGSTRVDVESGAQVQGLPSVAPAQGSADSVACFYLRVGRVKVSVAADRFIVRTPVGQIDATSGSVFRVRVVLDGSMRVESMAGSASVMTRARQRWTLTPNQSLSVEPDGSATRAEVESGM